MGQEQMVQKEIDILGQDILEILRSLNGNFPKLIGDIILTMEETMADSNLAKQILKSMQNEVAEEDKQHISYECLPQEDEVIFHTGVMWDRMASVDIQKELARPNFALREENDSDCIPCDDTIQMPVAMGILGEASKKYADALRSIEVIRNSVQKLKDYRILMEKNSKAFEDELKVVNLILDIVDDYCS